MGNKNAQLLFIVHYSDITYHKKVLKIRFYEAKTTKIDKNPEGQKLFLK